MNNEARSQNSRRVSLKKLSCRFSPLEHSVRAKRLDQRVATADGSEERQHDQLFTYAA